jgi:hypothetical protein
MAKDNQSDQKTNSPGNGVLLGVLSQPVGLPAQVQPPKAPAEELVGPLLDDRGQQPEVGIPVSTSELATASAGSAVPEVPSDRTTPSSQRRRPEAGVERAPLKPKPARSRQYADNRRQNHRPADNKQTRVLALLRHSSGATVREMMDATGWQAHSVRGFLSAVVKKRLSLPLTSDKGADGERRYRIPATGEAR